jgi:surfactin synthase thioesterase subunit
VAFALTQRLHLLDFPLPQHLIASGSKAPHLEHEEEKIHDLPHHEFLNRLEKFNGTPKEILSDTELMEVLIPLLRSDFKISYYYQAKPIPIACPILIMGGDDDPVTNHERLTAWKELFTGKSEVIYVPGGHFFINQSKIIVIKKVQKVIFQVIKNNVSLPNLAQPENYA